MIIERLQRLNPRERLFLIIGTTLILILILYTFILNPFFTRLANLKTQIQINRSNIVWLQNTTQQIQQLKQSGVLTTKPIAKESFLVTVNNSLQENHLANYLSQINQTSSNEVHAHFDNIPFDLFIQWLTQLWQKYRISTNNFTLLPSPKEGLVMVDIHLKLDK